MTSIHMSALKVRYKTLKPGEVILDVRIPDEYAESHVPGSKSMNHCT